jgi:hypothetical protein
MKFHEIIKNIISIFGRYKTGHEPSPLRSTNKLRMPENRSTFPTTKLKKNNRPYRNSCRLKSLFDLKEKNLLSKKFNQKIIV